MNTATAISLANQAARGNQTSLETLLRAIIDGTLAVGTPTQVGEVVAVGTPVTNQGDLANDANGTAIASAVNGLRDALVDFGIMQPGA